MSPFNRFVDLSQPSVDEDFRSIWSNTGLVGSTDLTSLSAESSEIVRFVRYKLGEPVLTVELDNSQIYMAFEEASLEYSRTLNLIQISNQFANIIGLSQSYNIHDLKTAVPSPTFNFLQQYAKNYGALGPNPVGGNVDIRKGYFTASAYKQEYNIYNECYDKETNLTLGQYIAAGPLSANNAGVHLTKLYHQPPISLYKYFDPFSNYMLMDGSYAFESYRAGGLGTGTYNYYISPIWNDILRGTVLKQGDLVRKSNYSFNQMGDRLLIMPSPRQEVNIYFEWYVDQDAFDPNAGILGVLSSSSAYQSNNLINSLWNVPITDIHYNEMNTVAKQWIREYTVALCKELLGLIRNKFKTIPIPNGDVNLNGDDLIQQGRETMDKLKEELRTDLEQFKKENMMEKEAKMAEQAYTLLKYFPLGGPKLG
jgi:hypothetical protein